MRFSNNKLQVHITIRDQNNTNFLFFYSKQLLPLTNAFLPNKQAAKHFIVQFWKAKNKASIKEKRKYLTQQVNIAPTRRLPTQQPLLQTKCWCWNFHLIWSLKKISCSRCKKISFVVFRLKSLDTESNVTTGLKVCWENVSNSVRRAEVCGWNLKTGAWKLKARYGVAHTVAVADLTCCKQHNCACVQPFGQVETIQLGLCQWFAITFFLLTKNTINIMQIRGQEWNFTFFNSLQVEPNSFVFERKSKTGMTAVNEIHSCGKLGVFHWSEGVKRGAFLVQSARER